MVDMSLSQAITRRFQASILLPSLPRPPPEVARPFTPAEAPIERSQEPTRTERDAERREREADARSTFRSGFIAQEIISLSAQALQLNQSLSENIGVSIGVAATPEPPPQVVVTPPSIETIELEPITLPDEVVNRQTQIERQASIDFVAVQQNVQAATPTPSRSIDLFG